jgi:site-specific DNA-methyltransferase (adenine-specific)
MAQQNPSKSISPEFFLKDRITLYRGDCLEVLPVLDEASIDSVVCDPPYHLTSIVKRFGAEGAAPALSQSQRRWAKIGANLAGLDPNGNPKPDQYGRLSKGFMGKQWDGGDIAFQPAVWAEVMRVLKPGGHLIAFGGTRTYHRMACAIEDAGFEIRDQIGWCYGSGFPKSHDVSKGIDRMWQGWGTALKPAWEPIVLARKPLSEKTVAANVLKWGTGAINVDGCRIGTGEPRQSMTGGMGRKASPVYGSFARDSVQDIVTTQGRWPANLIHDGSEEVLAGFPDSAGAMGAVRGTEKPKQGTAVYGDYGLRPPQDIRGDSGSAARFFYCAKASSKDRADSKHPTVKPLALMQYLVRLVTPKGGTVLDPFAGTGTTGESAWREGFRAVLIERENEYQEDIVRRMGLADAGPDERERKSNAGKQDKAEELPLFSTE